MPLRIGRGHAAGVEIPRRSAVSVLFSLFTRRQGLWRPCRSQMTPAGATRPAAHSLPVHSGPCRKFAAYTTGTYASDSSCAVSGTGVGEYFICLTLAREVCTLVQQGMTPQQAADHMIHIELPALKGGEGGVIVIAPTGDPVWSSNTLGMFRARRRGPPSRDPRSVAAGNASPARNFSCGLSRFANCHKRKLKTCIASIAELIGWEQSLKE